MANGKLAAILLSLASPEWIKFAAFASAAIEYDHSMEDVAFGIHLLLLFHITFGLEVYLLSSPDSGTRLRKRLKPAVSSLEIWVAAHPAAAATATTAASSAT